MCGWHRPGLPFRESAVMGVVRVKFLEEGRGCYVWMAQASTLLNPLRLVTWNVLIVKNCYLFPAAL